MLIVWIGHYCCAGLPGHSDPPPPPTAQSELSRVPGQRNNGVLRPLRSVATHLCRSQDLVNFSIPYLKRNISIITGQRITQPLEVIISCAVQILSYLPQLGRFFLHSRPTHNQRTNLTISSRAPTYFYDILSTPLPSLLFLFEYTLNLSK